MTASKLSRRDFLKRAGIVGAGVLGLGWGWSVRLPAFGQGEPIRIGAPLAQAFLYGQTAVKNLTMAVEEINAAGGVNVGGTLRPFELYFAETRDLEPGVPVQEALLAVERLILEQKVDVILGGPIRSEAAIAAQDLLAEHRKVSILTTGVLSPTYTRNIADPEKHERYRVMFRITSEAVELSRQMFDLFVAVRDKFGFDTVFILVQDVAHARAIGNLMSGKLSEAGFKVVGQEVFPTGAADYSVALLRAQSLGANLLLVWMDHPETAILARQWTDLKIPAMIISGINSFLEQPGSWDASDGAIAGLIASTINAGNTLSAATPATLRYFSRHVRRWDVEPEGYGAVTSYWAVYVLKEAIERAGSLDPDALVAALEETDSVGPYGRTRFDPQSHQVIPSDLPEEGAVGNWHQWLDGERVTIWPPSIAVEEIQLPPVLR